MRTRVEIRCCCQPTKLLGWIQVDDSLLQVGELIRFATRPEGAFGTLGSVVALPVATFYERRYELTEDGYKDVSDRHLAMKSEETPIEVLERIPGFQRNDQP